ncbi:MAG: hypothetical protein HY421_00120 [Candidatus Kerfeldbacteria bacterium]|nr:hypothetical protein [Candidatus Kerfeldbacteria bacterium]
MERKSRQPGQSKAGFTLVESILSLFVVSIMVALLVGLASTRDVNRRAAQRSQAAALADEEINALRRLDFTLLTDQTNCVTPSNCPFKNVLYNAGRWAVVADGTAPSQPNALELALASGFTNTQSGQLQFPAGTYGDATFTVQVKVATDSVSNSNPSLGWAVGMTLRSRDAANGYRLRFAENDAAGVLTDLDTVAAGVQNVYLEKIAGGSATPLGSTNVTLAKGTWYTLEAAITGTSPVSFTIKVDGTTVLTSSDSSSPYASGSTALIGWNDVHALVDDVQDGSGTWNFDGSTELPLAWVRLGLNDLPDSTPTTLNDNGTVEIVPYPQPSSVDLKKVTVTVGWVQKNTTQTYTTTSLIGKSELGL